MKTKHIFTAVVALSLCVACTNEMVVENNPVTNPETDEQAWMSLRFSMQNQAGTYAPNGNELGTADETRVDSAIIIFFDNALNVVDFVPLGAAERGIPGQISGSPGDAFKVHKNAKYLMAVINPPASYPSNWPTGTSYATVNAAVTEAVGSITSLSKGFMMTNSKGYLEPSSSTGDLVPLTLYYSANQAETNPCVIRVDRVAAKVRLYTSGFTAAYASVSNIQWVLNVTNRQYYPLSQRVKTYVNASVPTDPYAALLGTYREDPNYNNSGNVWGTMSYDNNYNYYTSASISIPWVNPCDAATPGNPLYCLENTQRAADNYHAYTTQILIKAKYLPNAYTKKDGTTTNTQGNGGDWIQIFGTPYTYATLMTYISAELTAKYAQTDPALYNTPICNAFNAYLSDPSVNIGAVSIPNTSGTVAQTIINAFANKQTAVESNANKAATVGKVMYYAGGICYYKVMIKHDDTDAEENKLGEFGVVRNSVYDARITHFNNPGYPVIPNPDPTTPNDPDNASWLAVQININPWTEYTQVEEL